MKTKEKILEDKGILLVTFYSSSIYDAVLSAMQEHADQAISEYKSKLKLEIINDHLPTEVLYAGYNVKSRVIQLIDTTTI